MTIPFCREEPRTNKQQKENFPEAVTHQVCIQPTCLTHLLNHWAFSATTMQTCYWHVCSTPGTPRKHWLLLSMCGDYSMSVHYFYSERVAQMSGPCKIIHGMEPLAGQLTGPLIIPGLSLQESRLTRPSRLKYLHLETDNINTHWTVFRWIHLGLFQAELLWIAN